MAAQELLWILGGGLLMSAVAMIGALATVLPAPLLQRLLLPLIALAAGTLLGSAFFHMIPEGSAALSPLAAASWLTGGFAAFFALEQFLHWHHSHREAAEPAQQPVAWLILIGDGVHNFLGGLGIASTFLVDPRAGALAWLAAAAHEVPQELGDFGVLVHGGWSPRRALAWNLVSALTFPVGALLAWLLAHHLDVAGLVLFAAGNFVYIAASDLIPEIKRHASLRAAALHFAAFAAGLLLMALLAAGLGHA